MSETPTLSRRLFLGGAATAALLPGTALAQTMGPTEVEFAAVCRAFSGFDPVPAKLVTGAARLFPDDDRTALTEGTAPNAMKKALLKSLYTGVHSPANGDPVRLAYSEALMFAAVEDSLNVPSYCGGVPGYWAEEPVSA